MNEAPSLSESVFLQAAQAELLGAQVRAQAAACDLLVAQNAFRPSSLYMPMIYHDGLQWVAWYGGVSEEIKHLLPEGAVEYGVKAMGANPAKALANFDSQWLGTDQ